MLLVILLLALCIITGVPVISTWWDVFLRWWTKHWPQPRLRGEPLRLNGRVAW